MNTGFISIPKEYISTMSPKTLLVASYLRIYCSISGRIVVSIDNLSELLGYKSNPRSGRINDKLDNSLSFLQNIEAISLHNLQTGGYKVQLDFDHELFNTTENFVLFTEEEIDKICSSIFPSDMLFSVFIQIKKYIYKQTGGMIDAGKYCFVTNDVLLHDIKQMKEAKMSKNTLPKYIGELMYLGLLSEHRTGMYIQDDSLKYCSNFYNIGKEINHAACDIYAKEWLRKRYGLDVERFIK